MPANMSTQEDTSQVLSPKLQAIYHASVPVKLILDKIGDSKRSQPVTPVDDLEKSLLIPRKDLIQGLHDLAAVGTGEFVVGRKGWPTRFVWGMDARAVARMARGETLDVAQLTPKPQQECSEALQHTYQLREGFTVTMGLPSNLTQHEADRLAGFIRTLPFMLM